MTKPANKAAALPAGALPLPASALPANALLLLDAYIADAPNWNGTPLLGGNVCLLGEKEDRGLLTYLKRAGLLTTDTDEDGIWITFTEAGLKLGAERFCAANETAGREAAAAAGTTPEEAAGPFPLPGNRS